MRLHYKRGIVFLILAFFLPFVLQEGTVTAAGAKVDTSNGTRLAVTISSDIWGILDKGTKGAVSYLQE